MPDLAREGQHTCVEQLVGGVVRWPRGRGLVLANTAERDRTGSGGNRRTWDRFPNLADEASLSPDPGSISLESLSYRASDTRDARPFFLPGSMKYSTVTRRFCANASLSNSNMAFLTG
jgi:hypothetical protein